MTRGTRFLVEAARLGAELAIAPSTCAIFPLGRAELTTPVTLPGNMAGSTRRFRELCVGHDASGAGGGDDPRSEHAGVSVCLQGRALDAFHAAEARWDRLSSRALWLDLDFGQGAGARRLRVFCAYAAHSGFGDEQQLLLDRLCLAAIDAHAVRRECLFVGDFNAVLDVRRL